MWTWIATACLIFETSYHVHTFLLSLPAFLKIIHFLLDKKHVACSLLALLLRELLLPSTDVFNFLLHFLTQTEGLVYKPLTDFGFVSTTVLIGVGFLLKLWSFYLLPCCACGSRFITPLVCTWLLMTKCSLCFRLKVSQVSVALPVRSSSESAPLPVCSPSCALLVSEGFYYFFQMLQIALLCDICLSMCMVPWGLEYLCYEPFK